MTRPLRVLDPKVSTRIDHGEVMRWIIDGSARYLAGGLPELPEGVRLPTQAYEAEVDQLSEFVSELRCQRLAKTAVFDRYTAWATTRATLPLTRRALYKTLREDYDARDAKSGNADQLVIPD